MVLEEKSQLLRFAQAGNIPVLLAPTLTFRSVAVTIDKRVNDRVTDNIPVSSNA